MYVISVILDIPLRQSYSYTCEQYLEQGTRVIVEFRNQEVVAWVNNSGELASFHNYPKERLKPILQISRQELSISPEIWQICEFATSYYHHPFGLTLFSAIPPLLKKSVEPTYSNSSHNYYLATSKTSAIKGHKQQILFNLLKDAPLNEKQIQNEYGSSPHKILEKWLAQDIVKICLPPPKYMARNPLQLNSEQQEIFLQITQNLHHFHVGLLYGITGSGKTEVFLHLIAEVLRQNKQILVIVPEINLTPQLANRFHSRFPNANISLINSEIGEKSRFNAWIESKNGTTDIILGTRLSIFTPTHKLGLIIVDEEHDESFKQNDGLRYNARDLAVWRAKFNQVPILLASATPSLETLYNYKLGKYALYKLTKRAVTSAQLPQIELINLQHNPVNYAGISELALTAIHNCLEKKELVLVFINRRGYAPIITCYECSWVSTCRYCSTNMVYHHEKHNLKCHHCGYQIPVPPVCPSCKNQYLHTIGHGTQKLEEFLTTQFSHAKIKRVDRDTTNSKITWQEIYDEINQHKIDILVGTQMLAKGHDFPNLTLVIGLNLDNALFSYDFRASEDMFNILTQVAGRAGRAEKAGQVLLQTNYPAHPVYQFLLKHDFNGFINHTLNERRLNQLPPFSYYALIKISSLHENKLSLALQELYRQAKQIEHFDINIFRPVPAVLYKLHNRFRGQMLIYSKNRHKLHEYLSKLENMLVALKGVSTAIDVDPFEL